MNNIRTIQILIIVLYLCGLLRLYVAVKGKNCTFKEANSTLWKDGII
ncbi:hypothetical protein C8N47_103107 [Mangrovibacterium marinum]|uniref:Uncharacterized protein n=1 Tax=Mangrovibacterium marinum TaxID=1639118 RepID=A0A2T5C4Q2_9BACT|nr:hypothetical protein C8N47_103107 [Mangrovibacterium marinum]